VKAVTENTSSNSSTNAPAATLGDNNDVCYSKMEKRENKFIFIKSLTGLYFLNISD
jgi:hypothetical protein